MKEHSRIKRSILVLLAAGFLLRLGYWSFLQHPKYCADTPKYLDCAKMLASGDTKEASELSLLYKLYPLFLSPIYAFNIPEEGYIKFLHIIFSGSTVFLLYYAGTLLISHKYGLWVSFLAVFYPNFIFWLPYILTETVFLFFLALFIVTFLILLRERSFLHLVNYLAACALLLFTRPVSLPILAISAVAVGILFVPSAFDINLTKVFVKAVAILTILLAGVIVFLLPYIETFPGLLKNHQFVQNFYRSTTITTNNMDEQMRALGEEKKIAESMTEAEFSAYRVKEAVRFVSMHPFSYLRMCVKRFIAFWYPWMFAVHWSRFHVILDFFVSFSFSLGVLALLFDRVERRRLPIISLIVMALSLGVITAFGHLETDDRLRLPAELIFLLVAPYGLQILLHKARALKRVKVAGGR